MPAEPSSSAWPPLRRLLIRDFLSRWKWGLAVLLLVDLLIALILLSSDGTDGFPVLILFTVFLAMGGVFPVGDARNGWMRVVNSLPVTGAEFLWMRRFVTLLPAVLWVVVAALMALTALFFGQYPDRLNPLLGALFYGPAASAVIFFLTGSKPAGRREQWLKTGWLLLPAAGWFVNTGHPAAVLFTLPLLAMAFIGWREMEREKPLASDKSDGSLPAQAAVSRNKTPVLKQGSRVAVKWLLKQAAFGSMLGCFTGVLNFWLFTNRRSGALESILENLVGNSLMAAFFGAMLISSTGDDSMIRVWRSLPVKGRELIPLITLAPALAALASVLVVMLSPVLLSVFEIYPPASDVGIAVSCAMLFSLMAPVVLKFRRQEIVKSFLTVALFLGAITLAVISKEMLTPYPAIGIGLTSVVLSLFWMRRLLRQSASYRNSSNR